MKALSIQQPFAWAIIHGGKDIENRSWPTAYRGPLLIHAGKGRTYYDSEDADDWRDDYGLELPAWDSLVRGAVIGRVELVGCVPVRALVSPSVWAEGPYCWVLSNPEPLPPVYVRGALGLFDVEMP